MTQKRQASHFTFGRLGVRSADTCSAAFGVFIVKTSYVTTRAADKSLARPTSRSRRTESIVSLERGVCSCAELQVFSCYRG